MTCNDCMYHDRCYLEIALCMGIDEYTGKLISDIDKRCRHFLDKSKYKLEIIANWVDKPNANGGSHKVCSNCGATRTCIKKYRKYCGQCGASMTNGGIKDV